MPAISSIMKVVLPFLLFLLPCCVNAQNVNLLKGKNYTVLSELKGFEHYIPVKGYNVFDEMVCYRYQDTTTFTELFIFQRDVDENGRTAHKVADVLKVEGTGRHKILVVGNNKFAAFSQKNIIIAIEDTEEGIQYVAPKKSSKIHNAYTLQHKGYVFEKVPLRGLYRIEEDFYRER